MGITIEEIYREVLANKRNKFPRHTWSEDVGRQNAKRLTRYLIEEILKWDIEDVKKHVSCEIFYQYRLRGMLKIVYNVSPFAAINDAYPGVLTEWDLQNLPKHFWTKNKAIERLEYCIQQTNLPQSEFIKIYDINWIKQNGLDSVLSTYWNHSPYKMLNDLYPNTFKEYEMKQSPTGYWDDPQTALDVLRELLEEKYHYTTEEIYKVYSYGWAQQHGLTRPLTKHWQHNAFMMLNDLYPNRFVPWYFKSIKKSFWTKEQGLDALQYTIEHIEKLTSEDLKKVYSREWLRKHKLYVPCKKYWNQNIYEMVNEIYPNLYQQKENRSEITEEFVSTYEKWKNGRITRLQAIKESGWSEKTFYKLVKRHERSSNEWHSV